ncbi:MAG: NACHT domain-containing protein, partial [Anaerolineales bacterium]
VGRNDIPTSAGLPIRPEDEDSDRPRRPHEVKFVGLIGGPGMGKSFQLRRVGHLTAQRSLTTVGRPTIPVYIDLRELEPAPWISASTISNLILEALSPFWEEGSTLRPAQLLTQDVGLRLRILVDGGAGLLANLRDRAWQALNQFAQNNPQHEYIIALNVENFDPQRLRLTNVLIIQPLTQRKIKAYLTRDSQNAIGQALYAALKRAQLFDLAAMPWLLMRMLGQAQRGEFPQSHVQVLRYLVDDAIADIATDRGMRTRAAQTLHALAWRMQSTHRERLPIDEAFEIMAEVRGNRGYNLETLYQELLTHDLLDTSGDEGVSFNRDNIRAYCCAHALLTHPERARLLHEITAMLGRQSLYQWWRESLVWLSGLMDDPSQLIGRILRGVALSEGEYVFLAAQCIRESRLNDPRKPVSKTLRNYIINTLILRLDSQLELNVFRRVRAVEALGHLRAEVAIPHLVRLITDRVRQTGNRSKYEYSSVRLAGMLALREIVDPPFDALLEFSSWLVDLFSAWEARDLEILQAYLLHDDEAGGREIDAGQQALAAFILAHIQSPRAIKLLISTFLTPGRDQMTYRNVSTALTLLDPVLVTEQAILPLIDPELAAEKIAAGELSAELWEHRDNWYGNLIYMIGKIRTQNDRAQAFVLATIESQSDVRLIALAIQSLGWLYDTNSKERFEAIALGDFDSLNLPEMATETAYQRQQREDMERYVQRKALEALYYIGDLMTLARLQHRPADWPPELESTFYRTSEAILMRQTSQREGDG